MTFRIAVCSWSLRPRDPGDLIASLETLGVPAVQLALNPILDEPDVWGDAFDRLRAAGIEIVSGMMAMEGEDYSTLDAIARTGGVRLDETWPRNLAMATRLATLAADAGIGLVTFHAGFMPESSDDPERQALLDRLHLVADAFESRGVGLGLETGQETAETLLEVLDAMNRPSVGVNFDPANMILYAKGDPVASLRGLREHVRQIHVKDARPTDEPGTWGTEVPAGAGEVDWELFFGEAGGLRPVVPLVIEREAGDDRVADIAVARDLIQRHTAGW